VKKAAAPVGEGKGVVASAMTQGRSSDAGAKRIGGCQAKARSGRSEVDYLS
jgi:hypothetical protein